MNVSEQLLDILDQEGAQHIFGVAGDALNPLVTALSHHDNMQWIGVKHEGNGSFAAFAQGALGDNFGVCASTVGPGALHLVNGLYNAKKERAPVVAITGQIPLERLGTNYSQEVNLENVFDDICEYQAVIRSPEEAPKIILRAIRTAVNHNCVCRIELPADIAMKQAANGDFIHQVYRSESKVIPSKKQVNEAVSLIDDAEKVGILAGEGCRDAREKVLEFAGKIKAPITHTLRASDIFDHDTNCVVGLTGLIGNPSGYDGIQKADLLIMLGTNFPYTDFLPDDTKTIQVDIRPENIGNRTPVTLGLHAHIEPAVTSLTEACDEKSDDTFVGRLRGDFKEWKKEKHEEADPERDYEPMHPQVFSSTLNNTASDDALFVVDTGASVIWASNYMSFHSDRRLIGSFNHGSMAVGLPAALGAQLQFPDREVWGLVGDGAFNMTLHDFSTAVKYELPVNIIVYNNSQLGFVKIEMEEAGLAPDFDVLDVANFNFAEYAKLVGGDGVHVEHADEAASALEQAKNSDKPFIIDAVVNPGELSLPPHITPGEAGNFAISKAKEIFKAISGDKKQWENIKGEIESRFD